METKNRGVSGRRHAVAEGLKNTYCAGVRRTSTRRQAGHSATQSEPPSQEF